MWCYQYFFCKDYKILRPNHWCLALFFRIKDLKIDINLTMPRFPLLTILTLTHIFTNQKNKNT
jgi:hypothetical protein